MEDVWYRLKMKLATNKLRMKKQKRLPHPFRPSSFGVGGLVAAVHEAYNDRLLRPGWRQVQFSTTGTSLLNFAGYKKNVREGDILIF